MRLMQINPRLKFSKPSTRPTRSTTTNKPLPVDFMNKQAEMVKKQQARLATTALAADPTRPSMTDIKQRMAKSGYMGGGMSKKMGYAKGGMANCGASMKPNGAARGK